MRNPWLVLPQVATNAHSKMDHFIRKLKQENRLDRQDIKEATKAVTVNIH